MLLLAGGALGACLSRSGSPPADGPLERAAAADTTPLRRDSVQPGALGSVRAVPAEGWTDAAGRSFEVAVRTRDRESGHARRFGTITLRTTLRGSSPDLVQYPCSSCHLGRTVAMGDRRIEDAHQNIQPVHPALLGSACRTCHAPDAVELLALRSGDRVSLDQNFRLCTQCHSAQGTSWANGAHGKRLDGWQGRRVVMGCSDCHDPHRPAAGPRVPFRAPTFLRGKREDHP
jgi:hypothetical protein